MFNIHLEELGETAILHCSDPIVWGIEPVLCSAVTSQCEKQTIVLDLKRGEVCRWLVWAFSPCSGGGRALRDSNSCH
jgi:hypothetical protein